jgi:hypothetical protein
MRTWTAVTPSTVALPQDLALLLAPVRLADAASVKDDPVGRAEGVLLDDEGNLVAFVVRLSWRLAAGNPRTLVPASAMNLTDDGGLVLSWPRGELLAQPRLDKDLQRQDGEAGAPAVATSEVPAAPAGPGEGKVDVSETIKEGAEGTAIGAVVGGILGGLAGGPILGFALAAFFATGGGLIGFISGGGQKTDTAPDGAKPEHLATVPVRPAFQRLEERLRDPMLATDGLVHTTRFSPMATNEAILEPQPVLARAS